jgi:glycosyltransferase involved in cell wall biosynthesis
MMKIAQISPLHESVPPKMYGGTERIVSYLTEELVERGHQVTLFASADSITKAELISPGCKALRLIKNCVDPLSYHFLMLEMIQKEMQRFDIIHYHLDYIHYSYSRKNKTPHVTTLHGRLDIPELIPLFNEFKEMPVISISNSQKQPFSEINWKATIHHGLPENKYTFNSKPEDYFAFIGRFAPEKRPEIAIELCQKTNTKLKLAAKVDRADEEYYKAIVEPLLKQPNVNYIGEINDGEKNNFLGNAIALIFPINWPEPFGLVMIEAMACGTPVIAWNHGSVSEVIEHGVNGFIVNTMDEAIEAIKNIHKIDRKKVRENFEKRFTVKKMTDEYLNAYKEIISSNK